MKQKEAGNIFFDFIQLNPAFMLSPNMKRGIAVNRMPRFNNQTYYFSQKKLIFSCQRTQAAGDSNFWQSLVQYLLLCTPDRVSCCRHLIKLQ
jgi:hypothetical protein